jgi:hypothetical protein
MIPVSYLALILLYLMEGDFKNQLKDMNDFNVQLWRGNT